MVVRCASFRIFLSTWPSEELRCTGAYRSGDEIPIWYVSDCLPHPIGTADSSPSPRQRIIVLFHEERTFDSTSNSVKQRKAAIEPANRTGRRRILSCNTGAVLAPSRSSTCAARAEHGRSQVVLDLTIAIIHLLEPVLVLIRNAGRSLYSVPTAALCANRPTVPSAPRKPV